MEEARRRFAERALERVRRARPHDASVLDEARFVILTYGRDGSAAGVLSLSNFFSEWQAAAGAAQDAVFDRIELAASIVDTGEGLDEIRVVLVPRIRPRRAFEVDFLALAGSPEAPRTHYQPLATHLGVALAIDRPEHIEYIPDPRKYGLSGEEMLPIALANLERFTTNGGFESLGGGVFRGRWGDEYAPERMLLPDLFRALPLDGDPVVFLPGSECIYVAGSRDGAALERVLAIVDERFAAPRPLVDFAFVLEGATWKPFEPDGALGRELGARLLRHLFDAYAAQREVLQAQRKAAGDDPPYVAELLVLVRPDGSELTVTTWSEAHAYLPRAEAVGFVDPEGGVTTVAWRDVVELAADLLVPVAGMYPPRWEVSAFPDRATRERLSARDLVAPGQAPSTGGPERRPMQRLALAGAVITAAIATYLLTR